jgi:hypothetical protein
MTGEGADTIAIFKQLPMRKDLSCFARSNTISRLNLIGEHSSARSSHRDHHQYHSNFQRYAGERGSEQLREEKQNFNQPRYDQRTNSPAQSSNRDHQYQSNS